MINFIFDSTKYDKCGMKYRYNDFILFLEKFNIDYIISTQIKPNLFNIIDINYICDNLDIHINDSCYIFCGSSKKVFESIIYYTKYNKKPEYKHYISHNIYYAKCFSGIFLPMFLYINDIVLISNLKQYKYGVFVTHYDVNYLVLDNVLNTMGLNYNEILFMDNENCISNMYNKTSDKNIFYSSIETFLDFSDCYTNRHVLSRTYLELIANNIPIQIVSFNKTKPISFKGFSHIQYTTLAKYELFDLLNVYYNQKYFKTDLYSNYIKYILKNLDKPINLPTIEDYTNDNFKI